MKGKLMGIRGMKIGFIGTGKVGIAIAHTLKNKGFDIVAVSDNTGEKAFNTARPYLGESIRYTNSNMDVVGLSDVIAITTQDYAISEVAKEIYDKARRLDNKLFFHTSGAHPSSILKPLDEKGAVIGSLHPLQSFPDIDSAIRVLPDTYVFIEGSAGALTVLEPLGKNIGQTTVSIEGNNKVYYHLCAVFVCNLLCALLYASEKIMQRIDITLEPFFPIINATLHNIQKNGPLVSLTGPIVRGDRETVQDHIHAMRNMGLHRRIYKALSLTALDMVKERGIHNQETITVLQRILEAIDE
ncbi:MAG TPA: DUF2520 domain-containing protein [Syntrophorhabdus sp.]|nr:DUF2520 domain-containing protein [Syntrophorhabdus sp.]